jgi:3-oxoacyl-[acyl-carrier protein] reductase
MITTKPVLITGANGGIGAKLTSELIARGHTVVCQYHSSCENIDGPLDGRFLVKGDMTNEDDIVQIHSAINYKLGPVWGIVNLAGLTINSMSWKTPKEAFMKVIEANLLSTFLVSREFIPEMREYEGGRIINASSVVASSGAIGCASYCAAKAGIEGLTKAMALELASKNITVNALGLGYFDVGMIDKVDARAQDEIKAKTPAKRFGHVSEIAGLVHYLLSDEGAFTTGQVMHLNGGYHL